MYGTEEMNFQIKWGALLGGAVHRENILIVPHSEC